jgi:hypothetical protein
MKEKQEKVNKQVSNTQVEYNEMFAETEKRLVCESFTHVRGGNGILF